MSKPVADVKQASTIMCNMNDSTYPITQAIAQDNIILSKPVADVKQASTIMCNMNNNTYPTTQAIAQDNIILSKPVADMKQASTIMCNMNNNTYPTTQAIAQDNIILSKPVADMNNTNAILITMKTLMLTTMIILTACSRTPEVPTTIVQDQVSIEQHITDSQQYPLKEQKISSIKAFPVKESEALKKQAYLAEESLGTVFFLEHGWNLYKMTQKLQPHQVLVKTQSLACLGAKANQKTCKSTGITMEVSAFINTQCTKPTTAELRKSLNVFPYFKQSLSNILLEFF